MILSFFLILIFLNICLCWNYQYLADKLKIFDHPDNKLKIHKKKTPLLGGFFIIFNLLILITIDQSLYEIFPFEKKREIISFIFLIFSFFFIGLYDDKYKISFSIRIVLGILFSLMALLINQNLKIDELLFSFYEHPILLKNFSLIFTLFSILAFIHATNMFDGINSQLITYYLILNTFLFYISNYNLNFLLFYPLLVSLFILNFNGKIFLGDGGSYSLGAMYSFFIIYEYTTFKNIVFADAILILTLIPGLELLRLSVYRLSKGRNIFSGDLEHVHHLFLKRFNQIKTNFIVCFLILTPIILLLFYKTYLYLILLMSILSYFLIIYFLKKK
tara:strand:+ start:447 stop:1442 length:996 start_codon:yes stop_codon:yes gene_type:complete